MKVKAVIFDIGGTLVDPYSLAPLKSLQRAFCSSGYQISNHEMNRYMGLDKRHHIQCVLKAYHRKNDTAEIHHLGNLLYTRFKEDHARLLDQPIQIIPGFPEVYAHLKDKKIPMGVTTGYAYQETLQIMQQFRKRGYTFDSVVPSTADRKRPAPDMIYKNLEHLGLTTLDTKAVLKVDDSPYGIEEGMRAGCLTVGVARYSTLMNMYDDSGSTLGIPQGVGGHLRGARMHRKLGRARRQLTEAGSDYVINDLTELIGIIENLDESVPPDDSPPSPSSYIPRQRRGHRTQSTSYISPQSTREARTCGEAYGLGDTWG
jgi:phosphonoacetaldehyde hydrolase